MSQPELLRDVAAALHSLGISFMLTGSHASSIQGEFRSTHDIDLVVELTLDDVDRLFGAFPLDRFYLSKSAMVEAIRNRQMFNLLETATGEKVDFWILTDDPFDRSRFARRLTVNYEGEKVDVSSPEDTILMKLLWAKKSGGSEKQLYDVVRVYELQAGALNETYLRDWVIALGVEGFWQRVLGQAKPISPTDE
jgi:hypothetical protein